MEDRKVKLFIDVVNDIDLGVHIAAESFLIDYKVKWEKLDLAHKVYKRTFSPDVIVELFEGWESLSDKIYFNNKFILTFSGDHMLIHTLSRVEELPVTVDDFITFMVHNHELYWKREVYSKSFKI